MISGLGQVQTVGPNAQANMQFANYAGAHGWTLSFRPNPSSDQTGWELGINPQNPSQSVFLECGPGNTAPPPACTGNQSLQALAQSFCLTAPNSGWPCTPTGSSTSSTSSTMPVWLIGGAILGVIVLVMVLS